jgi:2-polyprenyl-3-methyl-5-hydroxy-6-metoxy-1,4-benzoquinol methylase
MAKQDEWTGERMETFVFNEVSIEHLHRYAISMELAEGKKVLDIACGEGYGSNLLATKALTVTGMDIDQPSIENAKKKYNKINLTFKTSGAEHILAQNNEFDLVVSFETLEHLSDHVSMLNEIKRVLTPAGLLIISTPDKNNYSDRRNYQNPFHKKELYFKEFAELLNSVFKNVRIYYQQMTHSSLINNANANGLTFFSGDFNNIQKNKETCPLYFIAIASDGEIPDLPNSLFSGNSIAEQELIDRQNMIRSSYSYRLGHFILYPFKLVRKIFKK